MNLVKHDVNMGMIDNKSMKLALIGQQMNSSSCS